MGKRVPSERRFLFWVIAAFPTSLSFWLVLVLGFSSEEPLSEWPFFVVAIPASMMIHLLGRRTERERQASAGFLFSVYFGFLFSLLSALILAIYACLQAPGGITVFIPITLTFALYLQLVWPLCVPAIHLSLWWNRRLFGISSPKGA